MADTSVHDRDGDNAEEKKEPYGSSASDAEQAKKREREMEESGEENAA